MDAKTGSHVHGMPQIMEAGIPLGKKDQRKLFVFHENLSLLNRLCIDGTLVQQWFPGNPLLRIGGQLTGISGKIYQLKLCIKLFGGGNR